MAPALEDGIPAHLRRSIDATLKGNRDIFKPPPRKQPAVAPIPLSPADLDFEAAMLPASAASSSYGDGAAHGQGRGRSSDGPFRHPAAASTAWGSLSYGPPSPAAASTVRSSSRAPPSLEQMIDAPPSGPAIFGAARLVGNTWARQQQREWYRGQLAKRAERVNAEAERLFLTAIGPIGMDQHVWAKLPDKVEAVARRNVKRQEALELHRRRLEEWSPQAVSRSAGMAVLAALAALREGGGGSQAGGLLDGDSEGELRSQGGSEGDFSASLSLPAGASPQRVSGSGAAAAGGGGGGGPQRRCMSALPHRYMETDIDRHRIRKALDQLAAKHADDQLAGPATAAAAAASSPSAAAAAVARLSPRPPACAGGGECGAAAEGPDALAPSPLALLQSLRVRREARWTHEMAALASRVSHFMEAESPASPRVAMAAATYKAELQAKAAASRRSANAHITTTTTTGTTTTTIAAAPSPSASTLTGSPLRSPSPAQGCSPGSRSPSPRIGSPRAGNSARSVLPYGSGGPGGRSQRCGYGSPWRSPETTNTGQAGEEAEEEIPPEKEAQAAQLVERYEAACRRLRLHLEPGISASLKRSFAVVPGVKGHCLSLVALTLTSGAAAEALAEVLPHCTHINALDLERCAVSAEALAVVLPALWGLPLRRLSTSNTDFPPTSWPWLQRALGRPTVWGFEAGWWLSLRQLSLAGNGLADQGLSALVEVLVAMPQLDSLTLRQCGLSDLSAPHMERLLGECGALRELDLGYNNLGAKAVGALARGLPKAKQLTRLSLPWNSVGGGVAQLCWTVMRLGPRHCRLSSLELAGTDLVAADLFALAAILRAWPHTPVRHLDLSLNNLVGVAGQCLLRHTNLLMQPGSNDADGDDADSAVDANSPPPAPPVATASGSASPVAIAGSFRALAVNDRSGGGAAASGVGGSGGGARPLVPILKMPGSTAQVAPGGVTRGDSPVKRLTINPNPQSAAPTTTTTTQPSPLTPQSDGQTSGRTSVSSLPLPPPSSAAAGQQQSPPLPSPPPQAVEVGGGGAAVAAAAARLKAVAAAAVTAAATAGRRPGSTRSHRNSQTDPEPMVVVTTGCVVLPGLPPGARLLVRPNGRPVGRDGDGDDRGDDEDGEVAGLQARERERQRERDRERERERERRMVEMQQQPQPQSQLQPSRRVLEGGGGGSSSSPASTSPPPVPRTVLPSMSMRLGPRAGGDAAAAKASAAAAEADQAAAAAVVVSEPTGPHAFHRISLDLGRDLPDRQMAALLLEHEVEARQHRYRSAFYGVKWQGKVHKRDGVDVDPLDPVFLGWTHCLPRSGLLELVVRALPAQLCPWLGNARLQCNTQSG